MNELIPVSPDLIGSDTTLSTNARDLHDFLAVDTDFKDWMPRRIEEYAFEEGKDFRSFLGESTGGRPPKEYVLSLDMAKQLAMVERTPQGKMARQYFIECERRAMASMPTIPSTLPQALRLAADMAEQKQIAEAERDEAIRTKAQIGNKREATAMATASAATREANRLKAELGFNAKHATIGAVENAKNISLPKTAFVELRRATKRHALDAPTVPDKRWGKVRAWPAVAWLECFDIDLQELFPAPCGEPA